MYYRTGVHVHTYTSACPYVYKFKKSFAEQGADLVLQGATIGGAFNALVHDSEGNKVTRGALCGVADEGADGGDGTGLSMHVGSGGGARHTVLTSLLSRITFLPRLQ